MLILLLVMKNQHFTRHYTFVLIHTTWCISPLVVSSALRKHRVVIDDFHHRLRCRNGKKYLVLAAHVMEVKQTWQESFSDCEIPALNPQWEIKWDFLLCSHLRQYGSRCDGQRDEGNFVVLQTSLAGWRINYQQLLARGRDLAKSGPHPVKRCITIENDMFFRNEVYQSMILLW